MTGKAIDMIFADVRLSHAVKANRFVSNLRIEEKHKKPCSVALLVQHTDKSYQATDFQGNTFPIDPVAISWERA